MNMTDELATWISVAVFFTDLDSQWPNSWRSEVWAGVRVCRCFTGEVPPCVWGECDFHVNWLHVSRIRPMYWRLNDDFDINRDVAVLSPFSTKHTYRCVCVRCRIILSG